MAQNLKEVILEKTNGGLDLIYESYPEARNVAMEKSFKIRDERTPSAHIHNMNGTYILKDFGGNHDKARNGIQVYADTHDMTMQQALHELAMRLGIGGEKHPLKPQFSSSPASYAEIEEGKREFEFKETPSKAELAFLAPLATPETLRDLNWKSVKCININKKGQKMKISSTESYPIFAREMHDSNTGRLLGYKIYQPRSIDSSFKFTYYPTGMHPVDYWHGLYEAKKAVKGSKKLESIVICSGERDAIVVRSMGFYPVWANSETHPIDKQIYDELHNIANHIYLIPDIDKTGREMGHKNMTAFPQLYVVWLPEDMKKRIGDQHKRCKDLRDWAQEHKSQNDFLNLLSNARSYQFWSWDKKSGSGDIDSDSLLFFLEMNGFARIKNEITKDYEYVRVKNHIVSPVTTRDMRDFVIDSVKDQPHYVRSLVLNSRKTELKRFEDVSVKEFDFTNSTPTSQVFFFGEKQFLVTEEEITEIDEDSKVFVREEKVSQHNITRIPAQIRWKQTNTLDAGGFPIYQIGMTESNKSFLFAYLADTAMIHWKTYHDTGKLSEQQDYEDNQALGVKLFHIGYMLHRKRIKSLDWAPILMDYNTPADSDVASGGVGKSFLYEDVFKSAGYKVVKVQKQSKRPSESDFLFDQVTPDTDIVYFDECGKDFHYEDLNDVITGDLVVNKKHKSIMTIPYASAPKIAFITNYVPKDFGASSDRRHIYDVFSDYFHHMTPDNGYDDTRTIKTEFLGTLMQDDYDDESWNYDMNLLMDIEQFYLEASRWGMKPTPPMTNIMKRHDVQLIDSDFNNWAEPFYSNPDHLNVSYSIEFLLSDCNSHMSKFHPLDKKTFKKDLRMFANIHGLEYNPLDVCNDKIAHRIKYYDGKVPSEKIYLRGTYED